MNSFLEIENHLQSRYGKHQDPWGLDPKFYLKNLNRLKYFYTDYFKVQTHGLENLNPNKNYLFVANHSGQIPIDALLICMSLALEDSPPRILRPLVERFLMNLPLLGRLSAESGSVLGDRQNCLNLLDKQENLLIFPEGVSGISKNTSEFYKLKPFTYGFYRMALQKNTSIIPVAVVGAEEFFPFVKQLPSLARWLNIPALPISLNMLPLPSPVDIYFGEEIELNPERNFEDSDALISIEVNKIKNKIQNSLDRGRRQQRTLPEGYFSGFFR